ncbi:MAG: heme b synthase [Desulfohalobiaceae bacterium]
MHNQSTETPELRLLAWEVTRACNLACKHCRAEADPHPRPDELSTLEAKEFISSIPEVGRPIVIFTGGEPLLRADIFELVAHAKDQGLKCVMAPNGTLLDQENVRRMLESGIERVSISLDGPDAESHNAFRGVQGAFQACMRGVEKLKAQGLPFQVNTTVTQENMSSLPQIFNMAKELGAVAWHIFLLVPTGRARELQQQVITAQEYEEVLNWFYDFRPKTDMHLKATCAPHYHRILRQRAKQDGVEVSYQNFGLDAVGRGCLGGTGFCFVSHSGQVQPCGYLDLDCGQLRQENFARIWRESPQFAQLRDPDQYRGKCGVCEYLRVCGGCRARAQTMLGHYLEEEPLCSYVPGKLREKNRKSHGPS